MNRRLSIGYGLLLAAACGAIAAEPNKVHTDELIPLLDSVRPAGAAAGALAARPAPLRERPTVSRTPGGYLESLSAPPGTEFPSAAADAGGPPEVKAKNFLKQNGSLFGVTSPKVDFKLRKKNSSQGRHSIRMTQTYEGLPVFGGEAVVQVNATGGVEYVSGNFDRDTADLDEKRLSTKPKITAATATESARTIYAPKAPGQALAITPPELTLFVPSLLKLQGPKRLTWQMEVWSADRHTVGKQVFIDAHSGEFVQEIALIHDALNRQISDAANTHAEPGTLVLSEGGGASAVADANQAYDYLGDTYTFYFNHFGRDGIDGAGAQMLATVRYIHWNPSNAPLPNATWNGSRMKFDPGYAVDDVTGHELTHGVTSAESGLIYLNESGAINESLSDVFGEFVDQVNGRGSDGASYKWLIGEDLPYNFETATHAIRSMKNPHSYPSIGTGHPDWRGDSRYRSTETSPGTVEGDYGGVHSNSGVNNKLCYLLTDGERFREITVTGMGIDPIASLYYEANVNLLTSSSGWSDLANALRRAANNHGWNTTQRQNLENALQAVGIGSALPQYYMDENASTACTGTGDFYCSGLFDGGPYKTLSDALTADPAPRTVLVRGTAHKARIDSTSAVSIRPWDGPARLAKP